MWENIPLVLEPSKPDDLPAQSTLDRVWTQVEKDWKEALTALPVSYDAANAGRPKRSRAGISWSFIYAAT